MVRRNKTNKTSWYVEVLDVFPDVLNDSFFKVFFLFLLGDFGEQTRVSFH